MSSLEVNAEALAKLSEAEQAELAALGEELNRKIAANPLSVYRPHPKQKQFHAAQTRIKAFIGGNRSGKSTAGVADCLIQAIDREACPAHLRPYKRWEPPFKCRIFTPDFTRTMEVVYEKIREMVPKEQLRGNRWDRAFDKVNRVLRFRNDSLFDFLSYETDPDKLGGVARHRIMYDEEPPEQFRKLSRKRLIDYGGDELFCFTPELGISWTYEALYERRGDPEITVVSVSMLDNPHLALKEIEANLEGLSEEERRVALAGEFVALGGLFYPEWNEDQHVTDPPDPRKLKGRDIICAIDPGYRTTACIWIAFDKENGALAFDEVYARQALPPEIAERIREKNRFWGVEPRYLIDPSARIRATVNAEQVQASFAREGILCHEAQADRASGIMEVKRRLQHEGLYVSRECQGLRWEFPRYHRPPDSTDEWEAVKLNDHGLDALRYGLMARAWVLPKKPPPKRQRTGWQYGQAPAWRDTPAPVGPLGSNF